ncbi:flagellar biosynthesis protein FlaG [Clostridium sp. 2-1]|uniref:flagellar protein FlaG n=1 Tax=Clostridium TaxID=1485 RepID=UPI000CDAF715|nr:MULTISPECIES: flagellar protein FlaG [Clostridium]MBN7573074.1 flagellar protein FlaG [Clostridium beijerinckii]MBN7578413.1 flagellar protein FlaG [Clostridium beijerinckii]MBN7582848.1 flagellar protein FlaG [Clostridium beijerinckii]MBO0519013.1 flagellar protein FlaG [Clostridium beijerinckii]POO93278.1 flagellar biosynthesis protein FlaG [Clostridium sp. 2-1]
MDVNNLGQNSINLNSYNSNLSEYTEANTDAAIRKVKSTDTQTSDDNKTKNEEYNKKDLDDALKKINNFLKDEHTRAEYSYYKELKTMMIKVVDENTNEVILEVPPKKILDMVASMMRQVGLLDKKA